MSWDALTNAIDGWRNGVPAEAVLFGFCAWLGFMAVLFCHIEDRINAVRDRLNRKD